MNKIPLPAIIAVVLIALVILIFSLRRSGMVGGEEKVPTGPPPQAMDAIRQHQRR